VEVFLNASIASPSWRGCGNRRPSPKPSGELAAAYVPGLNGCRHCQSA
jgi:hypothetical protein